MIFKTNEVSMKQLVKLINSFTINTSMFIMNFTNKHNIDSRLLNYIGYKLSKTYIVWR